jgi:hypothetical protein
MSGQISNPPLLGSRDLSLEANFRIAKHKLCLKMYSDAGSTLQRPLLSI